MYSKISIKNEKEFVVIDIEGTIGIPEEWQFEHPDQRVATYEKFRSQVGQIESIESSHIVVNIRSTGGDVNDAMLIYEALRSTGAEITTRCYGYTASAATIIAQAAAKGCREIAPGALYLIHNSICSAEGNADELEAQVDMLKKTDQRIAQIYAISSGREPEQFEALMAENSGRGRWLSPEEAIEQGLADKIVQSAESEQKSLDSDDEPLQESGTERGVKALAGGWRRLVNALRKEKSKESSSLPEAQKSVLHKPESASSYSGVALRDFQSGVQPSSTIKREDPSPRESLRSPNAEAYDEDIRRIRVK